MHEGKTLGRIAHEAGERAGRWARKWSDLGESQRAEWEEIGAAVACATIPAAAEGSLSMRVALEQISALCPAYSGEYAATVTPSDFGGNADDFSREQGLMQAAAIGDIARAALAAPKAEAWQFTRDGLFPPPDEEVVVWSQQSWEKKPSMKLDRWAEQHEAPVEWSSQTIPTGMGWDAHGDPFDVIAWMLPAPPTSPAPQEESK